jgi:Ca2+-binding RTX toxin-like protein
MATFTVTTSADDGAGSLRAAVAAANARAGADVIAFDAAVFDGGSEDLIRLTSGQIEIADGLTITGGPAGVTITGDADGDDVTLVGGITGVDASLDGEDRLDDNSRIFSAMAALTLDGLTLTGGRTRADGEDGGAVRGRTVTLIDSTVSGNSTAGSGSDGGGVSGSNVTLTNSTLNGNSTAGDGSRGGGVSGSNVTLTNSTLSGNSTAGDDSGGGGVNGTHVTLTNSTVSGNSTAGDYSRGGGVYSRYGGNVTLTNSTISGNSTAGDDSGGGGVYGRYSRVTLTDSIVLGNATFFAGVDHDEIWGGFTLTGGNIVGGDLFDDDADVGDVTATEIFAATAEIAPGLRAGVLADNGGPTRTILIKADGPAVDAGGAATVPTDQRGLARVSGAAVDLGAVEIGAGPAEPGSLNVTTALDVVEDDGLTSLREAVFFANFEPGADTIRFDASAFDGEAGDVIRLTRGQIEITGALTIAGGAAGVTITGDANGNDVTLAGGITDVDASLVGEDRLADNSRIFDATADLTLDGLTLTGGRTTGFSQYGGAVRGAFGTTLILIDSTVSGNSTAGRYSSGGGVSGGYVTLMNSTVSGNSTTGYRSGGGGVSGRDVTLIDSTLSGNSTAGDGSRGGGVSGSTVTLTNSTVSGNSTAGGYAFPGGGASGGGVSGSTVTLTNSTVSGNSTTGDYSSGGGVSGRTVTLTNSTVSGNSTAGDYSGGGVSGSYRSSITLTNSIVLGNAGGDVGENADLFLTGGNILCGNLFDDDADVGDVTATRVFAATAEIAPGVFAGVLADNGGPTRTILIAADGPAVDAGGAATVPTDQRGLARVSGAAVDLGAVETRAGPAEQSLLVVTTALDVVANDGLTSLREAAFFANLEPGTATITFDATVFDGEAGDVIRLTSGQIEITGALTIAGGAAGVTITGDANGDDVTLAGGITDVDASLVGEDRLDDNSRIFDATADLTLDGLTLTGGRTTVDYESGGAVRGRTVTLIDSTVSGNSTAGRDGSNGGGIHGRTVTLTNSTVSDNSIMGVNSEGGGVWGTDVTLTNSTVSGNSTAGDTSRGGGIGGSTVTLTNSTVSGNSTAGDYSGGGGVSCRTVTLTNSTVSGNSTAGDDSDGGGVSSFGAVMLTNSTVTGNSTAGGNAGGGGIYSHSGVTLANSIVLGNAAALTGGDEVWGDSTLTGGNILGGDLFDGDADVGDVTATEVFAATAEIAPGVRAGLLTDNGGPTPTIAIRADGPAAGAADPATALATDQRDFSRDDAPDLGAFEAGARGLKLIGGPGADVLTGGAGDDMLDGRKGGDILRGGAGDDELIGGRGRDLIGGEAGDDLLRGGKGGDRLQGGAGDDVIFGGKRGDRISGGTGDDELSGGRGRDRIGGLAGDDLLRGGKGGDQLQGGTGDDVIFGGKSGDRIGGGTGDDTLHGGKGRDVFVFGQGFGDDEIRDFDADPRCGQDKIDLRRLGISAASFAEAVEIERFGDDTRVTVGAHGSILIVDVDSEGANRIDQTDFLLA